MLAVGLDLWTGARASAVPVAPPVGGAIILVGEQNGVAADLQHPVDAERVAVKTAGTTVYSALDTFFQNAGTSPKFAPDASGALVWSPHNAVIWSEDISGANRVLANATTPTATFLLPNTTNAPHTCRNGTFSPLSIGALITHTCIVSSGGYTKFGLFDAVGGGSVAFNLAGAGSVLWNDATVVSSSITAIGGGQYQCVATWAILGTQYSTTLYVLPDSYTTGAFTGISWIPDGVKGLNIFRQQTNRGGTPTAYLKTTTTIRMGLVLDYDPATHALKGLLYEPPATNLLLNNAALSTQSVTVTAVAHTLSFLGTGTITLSGVSTAGPLVGTGASNRVSLTFTPTAGSLTLTVSGTVSNAQLETGAYPTSIIPTATTSITRAADNYTFLLSTIPALGSEYSLYARWSCPNVANSHYAFCLTLGINSSEILGFIANTTARLQVTDNTVSQANIAQGTITANTPLSTAARIKLNDCALSTNGVAPAFDTVVTLPSPTEVRFGGQGANAGSTSSFTLAKMAIITDRGWNDAMLQTKSAT